MTGAPAVRRVLVTGAAGSLAADIVPGLRADGFEVVGFDRRRSAAVPVDRWVIGSVGDLRAVRRACVGVDSVVHLAGIPLEAEWSLLSETNIDGTQHVLDAAVAAGVRKVVLASSIHAAGYTAVPPAGATVPDDAPSRPDTLYGVSKAAMEALGSLYHDRFGLDVVCVRIASRFAAPTAARMLASWLSPADATRLFVAALRESVGGFRIVWGVSANTRSYFSDRGGRSIGYLPRDDAEAFEPAVRAHAGEEDERYAHEWDSRFIGGVFASPRPPLFENAAADARMQERNEQITGRRRAVWEEGRRS